MAAFDYTDTAVATPLTRAVINCKSDRVLEALNKGFNSKLPDNRGWTPLHEAAICDKRNDCLKELLAFTSDGINLQTFLGETCLFLACENNSVKAIKILLKQPKCSVNLANSEGVSPLHVSCGKGNSTAVKLLIEFGAKVNSQDFNGYTPLHEAVSFTSRTQDNQNQTSFEICQLLLNHGANPDIMEYEGNYPFHLACQNGLAKSLNLLYSSTKNHKIINLTNNDGRTPLMMSAQSKNLTVVETLLSLGADPNIADNSNITALHLAAHSAHFGIFSVLHKATSSECVSKYCTFDEERDFVKILLSKKINSLICLAIDTEDLVFLTKVLECDFDSTVFYCPVVHAENLVKKSFTLHTPISFLLESKMYDLKENTLDFLKVLIDHKIPLQVNSENTMINYINPICAGLVALNDCPKEIVMQCLQMLLHHGADPDEPIGRMPYAMEQACMRGCVDAVLLLLQHSNVLEPEDVLRWIELETSSNQEKIVELLLPLAPFYKPSERLLPDISDLKRRDLLLPKVHSLANFCRAVIRRQLHSETNTVPNVFRQKLLGLDLPKNLHFFLSYR